MATGAVVSWQVGVPRRLPGVAFDSDLVFYGYRALVIFLALYLVTLFLITSYTGRLPSKVGTSGIEWGGSGAADLAVEQMLKLNLRLDDQQRFIESVVKRMHEERQDNGDLRRSLQRIDGELQRLTVDVAQIPEADQARLSR